MGYCPSQDWDRHCDQQEAAEMGRWLHEISTKIAQVNPYWNVDQQVALALATEEVIIWSNNINNIRVVVPICQRTLEPDETAIVIRTLAKHDIELKVFPAPGDEGFLIYADIGRASWHCVPHAADRDEQRLQRYLEFCQGDEVDVPLEFTRPDALFIGVQAHRIVYCDRTREKDRDYLKLAFLPYDTLELKFYNESMSDELRQAILDDAAQLQARRGEQFQISTSGQTVTLGRTS